MRQRRPAIGVRGGHGRGVQSGTSGPIGWPYEFTRSGMDQVCPARRDDEGLVVPQGSSRRITNKAKGWCVAMDMARTAIRPIR